MTARSALHTAGGVTDASDARLSLAGSFAKFGITPRTGVLYAGNQSLLAATATMAVNVSPLHFVGSKVDGQGVYVGANDGTYALTIAAAPGSGSRTDKVYIMQQDSSAGTTSPDASTGPLIAATSGSLPAGAVQIGTVTVPAGITKLTDAGVVVTTNCRWTVAAGAPVPVWDTTDRGTLSAYEGLRVVRLDAGGVIDTHDGTAWRSGVWQDFTPTLYGSMTGTPVSIGSTVGYARYRYLDPHTVQAQVDIARTAGSTITDGLGVSLPVTAARRYFNCGTLVVAGSTAPTNQSSVAYMSPDATKLIPVSYTNAYLNVDPLMGIRYSVTYEV